jgi:hypothetical protein
VRRIERALQRRGALTGDATDASDANRETEDAFEARLAASAVSGQTPPAGRQWLRGLAPLVPRALGYEKPLCASLDGFPLHAATKASALDVVGREALLRDVLRPPLAQERLERQPDGLLRSTLKRAYNDGTLAVDMPPLSLLCRLAMSVPPPPFHTEKQQRRLLRVTCIQVCRIRRRGAAAAGREGFGCSSQIARVAAPRRAFTLPVYVRGYHVGTSPIAGKDFHEQ